MHAPPRLWLAALALLVLPGTGCDWAALFSPPAEALDPTAPDGDPPGVQILAPEEGSLVAIGDSAFVEVRVSDAVGVAQVELYGFALRGDPDVGTDERIDRFERRTVDLGEITPAVRDTVLARFLRPEGPDEPEERVFIVVEATDAAGNLGADTVEVSIGGPTVRIVSPEAGASVRAGQSLTVQVAGSDPLHMIRSLRVRAEGAFDRDTTLVLPTLVADADTTVVFAVPQTAEGELRIRGVAVSGAGLEATSRTVTVAVNPPAADTEAPEVWFRTTAAPRMELEDSLSVEVRGRDNTQVERVGASVVAVRRATGDTVGIVTREAAAEEALLRVAPTDFGLTSLPDTVTISFEVTAFAVDTAVARNCGAATTPETWQSEACAPVGDHVLTASSGGRTDVLLVAGATVPFALAETGVPPTITDIATDGNRVFLANHDDNRVEVLPVGAQAFADPVRVGSEPWGLSVGVNGDVLFVANSGGTNISRISLGASLPAAEDLDRIHLPSLRVYTVNFTRDDAGIARIQRTRHDYSDRPQFLAQTVSGKILFSTKPTGVAPDGTIREHDPATGRTRMFVQYAVPGTTIPGRFVVLEAADVYVKAAPDPAEGSDQLVVCPRPVTATSLSCIGEGIPIGSMSMEAVEDSLARLRDSDLTDTRFNHQVDAELIGLSDTTYVAASADRGTVAFGEGVENPGRIMTFRDAGGTFLDAVGNTLDLVINAAEQVIGLALSPDGSLGVARGGQAYVFDRELRLQGMVSAGEPSGGLTLHPDHGSDGDRGFIDVVDTFHYDPVRRIHLASPVTGPVIALSAPGGGVLLYAVTARGVVAVEVD